MSFLVLRLSLSVAPTLAWAAVALVRRPLGDQQRR